MARADRERGRFRSFLLGALKKFLSRQREHAGRLKRGGGHPIVSLDALVAEGGYAAEPADHATPDALFERRWALTVLEQALDALRRDYEATDRGELFHALKEQLWGVPSEGGHASAADRLKLSEEAVSKAVQRLRRRLRDCLRAEIARTVSVTGEVEVELAHLVAVLRGG